MSAAEGHPSSGCYGERYVQVMRLQVCCWFVVLPLCISAFAQLNRPFPGDSLPQNVEQPADLSDVNPLLLSGIVKLEDGSTVPGSVAIEIDCGGQMHTEAYVDVNGSFNFQLNASGSSNQGVVPMPSDSMSPIPQREWQSCDLTAQASGYQSQKLPLSRIIGRSGLVNIGTIIMHPVATATAGDGFTISAADANVPSRARETFEKGQREAKKGKWAAAREKFEKALALYPRFASAWLALGAIQSYQSNFTDARSSFNQALQVDSRLVSAYAGLSRIAVTQGHWQELADSTSRLLAIDPVGLPQFWFLNSVANFNLHNFDVAEKSVLRAISLDTKHSIPKNEYLLGRILAVRHDYSAAAAHLKTYLAIAPKDTSTAEAQTQFAEYQRLSAAANTQANAQTVGK